MNRPNRQQAVCLVLIATGLATLAYWLRLQGMNRTNAEDDLAICILGIGAAMVGAGISIPSLPPRYVLLIALASPFVLFAAFVIFVWSCIILYALFYSLALWFFQP